VKHGDTRLFFLAYRHMEVTGFHGRYIQIEGRNFMNLIIMLSLCCGASDVLAFQAGAARASITTLEENIPTQLGGYGAREGKSAEGVLDTLYGKALVLQRGSTKAAIITVDTCSVPLNLVEETLAEAKVPGLTRDNVLMCASHTHTGLEGFALDRRNIADNPNIGIFSEPMLNFVVKRLGQALREANDNLEPVKVASGMAPLPDMNRNRRDADCVDNQLTMLRLDREDGTPMSVLVNFTAHGTFVDETDMLASGEWAGQMQRTVEDLAGNEVLCLYTNGAEGDIAPRRPEGGSHYEEAQNYGRKVGIAAWKLMEQLKSRAVTVFAHQCSWVNLPPRKGAPDFIKIAGDEYKVTREQLDLLLQVMFPDTAPLYALRINDFQMATFPGEPICAIGMAVKESMADAGIAHPCVASLTSEHIGYILTAEEYARSGYEVTASFYGDGLGGLLLEEAKKLSAAVAKSN
jgi:neutral ceramidase